MAEMYEVKLTKYALEQLREITDVKIKVPIGMRNYIDLEDEHAELQRNALMLYPAIKNLTISHGRAAEILGINKLDLIQLYAELGISYFD